MSSNPGISHSKLDGRQSAGPRSSEESQIASDPNRSAQTRSHPNQKNLSIGETVDQTGTDTTDSRQQWASKITKGDEEKSFFNQTPIMAATTSPTVSTTMGVISSPSPISPSGSIHPSVSPGRSKHLYQPPSSPPRTHSPASQIFERSVQEDILPFQTSPSIPSHIRTENHIPPVLEASSAAITDDRLDPDSVEIITHTSHQPAVGCPATTEQPLSSSWHEDAAVHTNDHEEPSIHGALDTNDVRRLSFISFADVVNAEHAEHMESTEPPPNRDSLQATASSCHPAAITAFNRSPSPLRSPASSHGLGTSPPTSISTSFKGLETSPNRGGRDAGSLVPTAQSPLSPNFGGEFNIETMRQALRRTGSGDLSGAKCQISSISGNDEVTSDRSM